MPRTDVPPPGQGKRARRKAWRDNADQATTIYSLTAEETAGTAAEEGMSHELPFWDDALAPQPQSQSQSQQPRQHFTEEEAQELVEKAYQDGWQQGMEDGYKLGKDKGYKEYKVQIEEEEAEKAKYQARNDVAGYQDTVDTYYISSSSSHNHHPCPNSRYQQPGFEPYTQNSRINTKNFPNQRRSQCTTQAY